LTAKPKIGRPTILTPDVHKTIVDACRAGGYFEDACRFAGIIPRVAYEWIAKADEPGPNQEAYAQFAHAIEQARAAARLERVVVIRQAGQAGDWRAAAWFLERTEPGKWGASARVTVKGDPDEPLTVRIDTDKVISDARNVRDGLAALGLTAADDDTPGSP
jgi:hypothetical protein